MRHNNKFLGVSQRRILHIIKYNTFTYHDVHKIIHTGLKPIMENEILVEFNYKSRELRDVVHVMKNQLYCFQLQIVS